MYCSKTIFVLLFIWLFAVFAPPVISLTDAEDRIFISLNQNEEEQQEQGKKDTSEEKIVQESRGSWAFSALKNTRSYIQGPVSKMTQLYLEIPLPPPEQKV